MSRPAVRLLLAAALLAAGGVVAAGAAPLRTESPATGVYQGTAVLGELTLGAEHGAAGGGEDLRQTVAVTELRYTPATSWSFALIVPRVESSARVKGPDGRVEASLAGLGDLAVTGKYRFFRQLGRWADRQAAVEAGVKLPTGESRAPVDPALPISLRRAVEPGSGSTDAFLDLSYQQAHGRHVQAAALGYRHHGEALGYRFGDEAHLSLDAEVIVLPRDYQAPGHELFALLEATLVHRAADTYRGAALAGTRRTELLLAPGLEYVATEQLALGVSIALPVLAEVGAGGRQSRWQILSQARYAF